MNILVYLSRPWILDACANCALLVHTNPAEDTLFLKHHLRCHGALDHLRQTQNANESIIYDDWSRTCNCKCL